MRASGRAWRCAAALVAAGMLAAAAASAQAPRQLAAPPPPDPGPEGLPDFNGVWAVEYIPNVEQRIGRPVPYTDFGREAWEKRIMGNDPTGYCQPSGPSRVFHTPFPVQIIQTENQVSFLFEMLHMYHRVFTDGRDHPNPVDKTWWGHSIGRYEGDSLIVDTVGLNDRTWLYTSGVQHSDELRLTQVFEKTGPDTIRYTVTYDDPVFFAEPWSVTSEFTRSQYDLLEFICTENNRDVAHFITE